MQKTETHYEILGIEPDASQDKINRAYTELLKEAQGIPDSEGLRAFMARAKVAHQVLSHPESRAVYHQQMEMDGPPKRTWELEGEPRQRDPAVTTAFSVASVGAPLTFLLLFFGGDSFAAAAIIGALSFAFWYGAVWGGVKLFYRLRDKSDQTAAPE
jgi:DnaJ-class molecular chaperone